MKARVTLTCTIEYEIDPASYPESPSPKICIEQDLEQFRDDHDVFWELADTSNATFEFSGELAI